MMGLVIATVITLVAWVALAIGLVIIIRDARSRPRDEWVPPDAIELRMREKERLYRHERRAVYAKAWSQAPMKTPAHAKS
jgi:hypothetical protein